MTPEADWITLKDIRIIGHYANLKEAMAVEKCRQAASSSSEAETDNRKITKNKKYRDDSLSPPPPLSMKPIEKELNEIHTDKTKDPTINDINEDEVSEIEMENDILSGKNTNDSVIHKEKLPSENNISTDSNPSQDSSDTKSVTGSETSKRKEFDYIAKSLIELKTLITYTMRKVDTIEKIGVVSRILSLYSHLKMLNI
ncbi:uncharacterized protein isoform X2 [Choristoneura fumiferana]|uniref:uncharacterized protein isoform X2 n=1 Tax=Choristoneura fumiferana TaxID=7141 RepID=UPI003D156BDF